MSVIKVTLPLGEIPVTGKQVSFTAPCDCIATEAIQIDGENYTVCDSMGRCVTGKGGAWSAGEIISVILDVENKKALALNAITPSSVVGSYDGTGEYGSANPNEITLPFVPSLVIVQMRVAAPTGVPDSLLIITNSDTPTAIPYGYGESTRYANHVTVSGRTVSWYSITDAKQQMNYGGRTYDYIAWMK